MGQQESWDLQRIRTLADVARGALCIDRGRAVYRTHENGAIDCRVPLWQGGLVKGWLWEIPVLVRRAERRSLRAGPDVIPVDVLELTEAGRAVLDRATNSTTQHS
jgi:hypothetical protein